MNQIAGVYAAFVETYSQSVFFSEERTDEEEEERQLVMIGGSFFTIIPWLCTIRREDKDERNKG
jgi:hypothetical protein